MKPDFIMKLLHTSDWHLGQTLHQHEREAEHARFLAQARQRVPHLNIVITTGNHDSPGRLQAPSPLLAEFGAHVVGTVGSAGHAGVAAVAGGADIAGNAGDASNSGDASPDLSRLVVPLRNGAGDVAAWCMAVPFLRPADVPRVEVADSGTDSKADDAYAATGHDRTHRHPRAGAPHGRRAEPGGGGVRGGVKMAPCLPARTPLTTCVTCC